VKNKFLNQPTKRTDSIIKEAFEIIGEELASNAKLKKSLKDKLDIIYKGLPPTDNNKIIQKLIAFYTQEVMDYELNPMSEYMVLCDGGLNHKMNDSTRTIYSTDNGYSKMDLLYIYIAPLIKIDFYSLHSYNSSPKLYITKKLLTKSNHWETNDYIMDEYPEYLI